MSLQAKLDKLERKIEAIYDQNPDHPEIEKLEAEANELVDELNAVEEAYQKRMAEEELRRKEEGLKARITSKVGNYLDWMKWAESLYPITLDEDGKFIFISKARDWKKPEDHTYGPFTHKIDALIEIEQLINWKIQDRNRGHGDMDEDLANAKKKGVI
jgi:DNA repair exonuclease SbcCD ATPase subunit